MLVWLTEQTVLVWIHPSFGLFLSNLLALTNGLGYVSGGRRWPKPHIPVNHPLDGPTGAFYVKGPVTGYGGIASSLKFLKMVAG